MILVFALVDLIAHEIYIQEALGRLAMTIDLWSNRNRHSFGAVSGHYIARNKETHRLELSNVMLAFRHFEGSHSGANLARHLFEILKKANLLHVVRVCVFALTIT